MNLADCYQVLELSTSASFDEIRASYRRLARQYHPDINPNDRQAKDKFIALTEAYKILTSMMQDEPTQKSSDAEQDKSTPRSPAPAIKVKRKQESNQNTPPLSEFEQKLKWDASEQLQYLLKHKRFLKAIALVEGLAQRFPHDLEVRSWQAITYQRWGSQLIEEKHIDKARIYLKKALKTDPHNRSLWFEVERDFRRLEKIF